MCNQIANTGMAGSQRSDRKFLRYYIKSHFSLINGLLFKYVVCVAVFEVNEGN
jgi:hypothetical protein